MWLFRVLNILAIVLVLWAAPLAGVMLLASVSFLGASFLPASHVAARYAIWVVAVYNAVVGVGLLVWAMWILAEPGSPVAISITVAMLMLPAAALGSLNAVALIVHLRNTPAGLIAGDEPRDTEPSAAIISRGLFGGIRFDPVALGVVVDWTLTILILFVLTLVFIDPIVLESQSEAVFDASFDAMFLDTGFLATFLLLGILATVAGAYVGARRAATLQLKHGLVIAVTSGLLGVLLYLWSDDGTSMQTPVWYEVMGWILMIPAGVLGGHLAKPRDFSTAD